MTDKQEQRRAPRADVKTSVSVFNRDDLSYLGLVLNCSDRGLMISSYEPLKPGTRMTLELVDIKPESELHRTGYCNAEIVWSKALTPSLFSVGCRLEMPCPTLTGMLQSYQQAS